MDLKVKIRSQNQLRRYDNLVSSKLHIEATLNAAHKQMDKILLEQSLLERSTVAIQQAKPLLSASSIKQCEALANAAISSVFDFPYTVEFDVESSRFILNQGDFKTDLVDSNGGGLATVVSTVFTMFLLVKMGARRFLAFDEAFTAISDAYIDKFVAFLRQSCHDLGIDIFWISHDDRVTMDMVDCVFAIEDGHSRRLK